MKRLLQSYKFYGALFGTASAFVGAKVFELDSTVIAMVLGLWASVIAGQAWKDAATIKGNVGGELPPDDDEQ